MTLAEGLAGNTYKIKSIATGDEELEDFLFTLGCYEGESISIVSLYKNSMVVAIKDGRYNIDTDLAEVIDVE